MADLRTAILTGTSAAADAHRKLSARDHWEQHGGRIDVFGAIDALGADLIFRPLDGLLGAYMPEPSPGIIINTRRPVSVRRYTGAHELGHFEMGHQPSLDDEGLLRREPFVEQGNHDAQEVAADAFAVAFLLPIWLVAGEMKRHGWTNQSMSDAPNVYQLSLRAGLSYEATCYALRRYKIIDGSDVQRLTALKPKSFKQSLLPDYEPQNWYLDVWRLVQNDDGTFVDIARDDVLQIELLEHSAGGYVWDTGGFAKSDFEIVDDHRQKIGTPDHVGGHVMRKLMVRARSAGLGSVRLVEQRPWQKGSEPITSYSFSYNISEAAEMGLLPAQREKLLGVVA